MKSELHTIKETIGKCAMQNFREGLNCSESVFLAYLDTQDTSFDKEVLALATGFGGGIGNSGGICGAVTGAILSLGTKHGRKNPFEIEDPRQRAQSLQEKYIIFRKVIEDVEAVYGTIICSELKAPYKDDVNSKARRMNCADIVVLCAELAEKYS